MSSIDIDRREFVGGVLGGAAALAARPVGAAQTLERKTAPSRDKITLEEHFVLPSSLDTTFHPLGLTPETWRSIEAKLLDVDEQRLPQMDANGVAVQVVSLSANGIQGEIERGRAVVHARAANDWLAQRFIAAHPTRFAGFAAVALQDPAAAAPRRPNAQ